MELRTHETLSCRGVLSGGLGRDSGGQPSPSDLGEKLWEAVSNAEHAGEKRQGFTGETRAPEQQVPHAHLQDPSGLSQPPAGGCLFPSCHPHPPDCPLPSPYKIVGISTTSPPPASSSSTHPLWRVGAGGGDRLGGEWGAPDPRRLPHSFLNVKCQLGVKSEPRSQLPGGQAGC